MFFSIFTTYFIKLVNIWLHSVGLTDILLSKETNPEMETSKTPKKKKKSTLSTIDKSHRLQQSIRRPRSKTPAIRKALENSTQRCIPPLSVLERMYEDSDEETAEQPPVKGEPQQNKSSHTSDASPTSAQPNDSTSSSIAISPSTAKKYADELLKILECETPPPPIIPMKRYKKPKVPYIVGCTERPKIPENNNCNVFKGDDYGITSKTNEMPNECEDNEPGFYSGGYNLCKSAFNAQANEIAARLLSVDNNPINVGSDSDDTVVYEVNHPTNRFSPQPSTSRDDKTMYQNDLKLRSYIDNNAIKKDEIPCECIDLDDYDHTEAPGKYVKIKPNGCVKSEIDTVIEIVDDVNEIKNDNKACVNNTKKELERSVQANDSPIVVDVINLNSEQENVIIDEIDLTNIDINALISQNKSLIDKHSKHKTLNVINIVKTDESASTDNTKRQQQQQTKINTTDNNNRPQQKTNTTTEQITDRNSLKNKNNLPVDVEPPSKKKFLGTCPICLDDLTESTIASTTCGHLFCLDCIKQVAKLKYKKCPKCRKRLTGTGYHKIYL